MRKVTGGSGNFLSNSVTGLSELSEGVVETKHDPINPVTGEYVLKYTDLSIPSPGVEFQLQRTYTTYFTAGTVLGKKWWHSYERRLVLNWDLSMMVRNPTGFPRAYESNTTEASTVGSYDGDPLIDKDLSQIEYTSSEWNTNILRRNADETYEAWDGQPVFPDIVTTERWEYDSAANITERRRDAAGESFHYSGLNRLVQAGASCYGPSSRTALRSAMGMMPSGVLYCSQNSGQYLS